MRIKVYQILKILFENVEEGIREFCMVKEAQTHFTEFTKTVAKKERVLRNDETYDYIDSYKGYGQVFIAFIDMLSQIATTKYDLFNEFLIKKVKILRLITPILLDSDNLKSQIYTK